MTHEEFVTNSKPEAIGQDRIDADYDRALAQDANRTEASLARMAVESIKAASGSGNKTAGEVYARIQQLREEGKDSGFAQRAADALSMGNTVGASIDDPKSIRQVVEGFETSAALNDHVADLHDEAVVFAQSADGSARDS